MGQRSTPPPNIPTRWGYILASETTIQNANTWDDLKAAAQTHTQTPPEPPGCGVPD